MNCLTLFEESFQAGTLGYEGKYPLLHGDRIPLPAGTDVYVEAMNGNKCLVRAILPEGNPTVRAWVTDNRLYGFDPAPFAPPVIQVKPEPEPEAELIEDATDTDIEQDD